MDPTIANELIAARHAEVLRAAEQRRLAGLVRASRPARRPVLAPLAGAATEPFHLLRRRVGQLLALGSPRRSTPAPCC